MTTTASDLFSWKCTLQRLDTWGSAVRPGVRPILPTCLDDHVDEDDEDDLIDDDDDDDDYDDDDFDDDDDDDDDYDDDDDGL